MQCFYRVQYRKCRQDGRTFLPEGMEVRQALAVSQHHALLPVQEKEYRQRVSAVARFAF
jgi:hypothetical protein